MINVFKTNIKPREMNPEVSFLVNRIYNLYIILMRGRKESLILDSQIKQTLKEMVVRENTTC